MTEDHPSVANENWALEVSDAEPVRGGVLSDEQQQLSRAKHKSGSSTDLETLYRDHAPILKAKLRQVFGNGPPDPDDIAQAAFEKLIQRGSTSDIASIKGYLWRTARNLFFNDKKRQSMRSRHDFEIEQLFFPQRGGESNAEIVLGAKEELRAINIVLQNMPERRRRAFLLHRVEGLSISEVARRLRIARSPADRHIKRAAEDIHICLAKLRADRL